MDLLINNLNKVMVNKRFTASEAFASVCASSLDEFVDIVNELINDNFEELVESDFFERYHLFLFGLVDALKSEKPSFRLNELMEGPIKLIKKHLRIYHKKLKKKDGYYHRLKDIEQDLKACSNYFFLHNRELNDQEEYQIMYFFINCLKKPDYVFRLIELHPEFVNLRDSRKLPIFVNLVNDVMQNVGNLSDKEIKNYKRIIVMFLESDDLQLGDYLFNLLKYLEECLMLGDSESQELASFIIMEIKRHHEVLNGNMRLNCVDYCFKKSPIVVVDKYGDDKREDMRDRFTFSVDTGIHNSLDNVLIEDAISIEETDFGAVVYVHIPDVDYFVARDSELDSFMRNLGESVWKRGYKRPLLDYSLASKCSLEQGCNRPALTFVIALDFDGNLQSIDFKKTIINVNYNFAKGVLNFIYKGTDDKRLKKAIYLAGKYASLLRKNRHESSNIGMSSLIMEEYNILVDLATAKYFKNKGLVFPYKNYAGKRDIRTALDVELCESFNREHEISPEGRNIVYSIFDIYSRVFYDTISIGNKSFCGADVGNVGNPLREYISLETNRLIKDLVIDKVGNLDFWEERIENDCIECTEISAKMRSLIKMKVDKNK